VLDPEGGLLGELLLPFKLGVGGPLAGGHQYTPWIHRDDEVGVILWALGEERAEDAINSTAPNPVTNREFSKTLGKVLRRPSIAPIPRLALVAMRGGELADQIMASLRVVPRRAQELGYEFRFSELGPALRDLLD
jgi:NAD dependent epimerase/dehydratase family enzyme